MHDDRRFPVESMARLDSPERAERQPPAPLVELVAALRPTRVLDVGAGTGYFALPLAARLAGARIIALDVEPRMLEVIMKRATERGLGGTVETLLAPAGKVPLADASVDLVLLMNIFHELDHRPAHIGELKRVLRRRGHLIICDWSPSGGPAAGPPVEHRVPQQTAVAELTHAGFADVTEHRLYPSFWTLQATVS
jgi:ubiquinone/menaquinone biosynthesis C-methylase UbiE